MRTLMLGFAVLTLGACSQNPDAAAIVDEGNAGEAAPVEAASSATGATTQAGTPFDVPSDPRASYALLSVKPGTGGHIEATFRREGPSGTSYTRREIDCDGQTFRYLGEGGTHEEAKQDGANPGDMAPLTEGSISTYSSAFACSKR